MIREIVFNVYREKSSLMIQVRAEGRPVPVIQIRKVDETGNDQKIEIDVNDLEEINAAAYRLRIEP